VTAVKTHGKIKAPEPDELYLVTLSRFMRKLRINPYLQIRIIETWVQVAKKHRTLNFEQ